MKAINLGNYRRENVTNVDSLDDENRGRAFFDPLLHSVIVQITISKANRIMNRQMIQTKSIYPTNRASFHHNMWQNGIPEWLSKRQKS